MDPLTAISLTGNVCTFVTVALDIVSKTSEISSSSQGASNHIANLETVYQKLADCSSSLSSTADTFSPPGNPLSPQVEAVKQLAEDCQKDCKLLLEITSKLRLPENTRSKWKSLQIAVRTILTSKETELLESRLKRTQNTLNLQICSIIAHQYARHRRDYETFCISSQAHRSQQSMELKNMRSILDSLKTFADRQQTSITMSGIGRIETEMARLSIASKDVSHQQSVISSLACPYRTARHDAITDAHNATLGWALHDHGDKEPYKQRLVNWLRSDDGLFWVSGKPGSGKSTFMKFVADNPETRSALTAWAGPSDIVIATHYFWLHGTSLQKSLLGLIQSLLYDIFRQCPQLVILAKGQVDQTSLDVQDAIGDLAKLRRILKQLTTSVTHHRYKFCFFIDGLDEYEADESGHLELCEDLIQMTESPNVKLCVSSRPWNVFEDAIGHDPLRKLYMHQVNQHDISNYTSDRLQKHPRWTNLLSRSHQAQSLVAEVTRRSNGVFLWVYLVTRFLRNGLSNDDDYNELLKRLNSLPTDLEAFFKHILSSVDPIYTAKMAGALQIALLATEPLDVLIYHFHERQYNQSSYLFELENRLLSSDKIGAMRSQTVRRLNGYCRGLLEITGNKVDFLHRTVVDFLKTESMHSFLSERSSSGFNGWVAVLRSSVALTKIASPTVLSDDPPDQINLKLNLFIAHLEVVLQYSLIVQEECTGNDIEESFAILEELERTIIEQEEKDYTTINRVTQFRKGVINYHLRDYLSSSLLACRERLNEMRLPPMALLLGTEAEYMLEMNEVEISRTRNKILATLLGFGCDPNEQFDLLDVFYDSIEVDWMMTGEPMAIACHPWTPWTILISRFVPWLDPKSKQWSGYERIGRMAPSIMGETIPLLLKNGADPNAVIPRFSVAGHPAISTAWLDCLVACFQLAPTADELAAFLRLMSAFGKSGARLSCCRENCSEDSIPDYGHPVMVFLGYLRSQELSPRINDKRTSFLTEVTYTLLSMVPGLAQHKKCAQFTSETIRAKFPPWAQEKFQALCPRGLFAQPLVEQLVELDEGSRRAQTNKPELSLLNRKSEARDTYNGVDEITLLDLVDDEGEFVYVCT